MGMKVCKLVKLTKKDDKGEYVVTGTEGHIVARKRTVVSEETVAEFKDNAKSTGLLYIVNEAETKKRDKVVEKEVATSRGLEKKSDGLKEEEPEEEPEEELEEEPEEKTTL